MSIMLQKMQFNSFDSSKFLTIIIFKILKIIFVPHFSIARHALSLMSILGLCILISTLHLEKSRHSTQSDLNLNPPSSPVA